MVFEGVMSTHAAYPAPLLPPLHISRSLSEPGDPPAVDKAILVVESPAFTNSPASSPWGGRQAMVWVGEDGVELTVACGGTSESTAQVR